MTDDSDPQVLVSPYGEAVLRTLAAYRRCVDVSVVVIGGYGLLTAFLVIGGGEQRMSAPIYATIYALWRPLGVSVPIALGLSLGLFATLALLPWLRVSQAGLAGIVCWHLYLAVSFLLATFVQPLAGFPGMTAELLVAGAVSLVFGFRAADQVGWHRAERRWPLRRPRR